MDCGTCERENSKDKISNERVHAGPVCPVGSLKLASQAKSNAVRAVLLSSSLRTAILARSLSNWRATIPSSNRNYVTQGARSVISA